MKLQRLVGVGLLALMVGTQACSEEDMGLLAQCNGVVKHMDAPDFTTGASVSDGLCVGMVEGVLKTMAVLNPMLPIEFQTCFPRRIIPISEAVRTVVAYLRQSELTNTDDATRSMLAIQEAYPCK